MAMEMQVGQAMTQTLGMQLSASQRLALEILQLNTQDLEQRIGEELESNPLLEIKEERPVESGEEAGDAPPADEERTEGEADEEHRDAVDEVMEEEWDDAPPAEARTRASPDEAEDKDDLLDSVAARRGGLQDRLREQVEFLRLDDPELKDCVLFLVYRLDGRGYLPAPLEELAAPEDGRDPVPLPLLQRALAFIQERLDPPGLGARDHKECLLLQVRHLGAGFDLEERVLRDHYEDLLDNRLERIAKAEQVPLERVKECLDLYASLEFRPGPGGASAGGDAPAEPASPATLREAAARRRPDAEVAWVPPETLSGKGRYKVRLRKGTELELVDGRVYRSTGMSKEERRFLLEKSHSAKALVEAIRRRNETLLLVVNAIYQRQRAFFEDGPSALRPLLQQDIAKDVGLSPATVARTVREKVLDTEWGIFPLSYFFSKRTVVTADGEESDRKEILDALKAVVDGEDKSAPLSDTAITRLLAQRGHPIATRTVSKYRDILGIPTSGRRRRF